MFKRPWKGQGNLTDSFSSSSGGDFGDATHILCLGAPEQVKGLQWALDHKAPSRRAYKVYRGRLDELSSSYNEYDYVVLLLDLGQPVPVEFLKDVAPKKEGLCAFIQPTPGQLLALNEFSDWDAVAWDGATTSDLSVRIDKAVDDLDRKINSKAFIDSARQWIKKQFHDVEEIRLINPPENWAQTLVRKLDRSVGVFSFGARESRADIKLPFPGSEDFCELRYFEKTWSVQALSKNLPIELRGDPSGLRCGDELQIHDLVFSFGRDSELDKFVGVAKKLDIIHDSDIDEVHDGRRSENVEDTIEGFCRALMSRQAVGELQVKAGHRSGSIYFYSGNVVHAMTGAVSGAKALLRIIHWPDSSWAFHEGVAAKVPLESIRLDLVGFTRSVNTSKKILNKVQAYIPPGNVSLKIVPDKFRAKRFWTIPETKVLASVGEYGIVRDILNYCPLPDAEIFETLIELRQQGLLLPVVAQKRNV